MEFIDNKGLEKWGGSHYITNDTVGKCLDESHFVCDASEIELVVWKLKKSDEACLVSVLLSKQ